MSKAKELLKGISEASLSLPSNSLKLTKGEAVKMIYLASGWVGRNLKDKGTESQLEKIALMIHDSD